MRDHDRGSGFCLDSRKEPYVTLPLPTFYLLLRESGMLGASERRQV